MKQLNWWLELKGRIGWVMGAAPHLRRRQITSSILLIDSVLFFFGWTVLCCNATKETSQPYSNSNQIKIDEFISLSSLGLMDWKDKDNWRVSEVSCLNGWAGVETYNQPPVNLIPWSGINWRGSTQSNQTPLHSTKKRKLNKIKAWRGWPSAM